jgi:hypothetical protein
MMNGHGVPEDSYAPDAKDVEIADLEAEAERLRKTISALRMELEEAENIHL